VLHEPVEQGNTGVVIEHNLEVIKTADWIIDLGPEGGDGGGEIVAAGSPEAIVREKQSYTGQFLRRCWRGARAGAGGRPRRRSSWLLRGPSSKRLIRIFASDSDCRFACLRPLR
jgi:hypothetical protein